MLEQKDILNKLRHDGNTWNGFLNYGTKLDISVSFFSQSPSYYQNLTDKEKQHPLSEINTQSIHAVDPTVFKAALKTWSDVASINFQYLADNTESATLAVVGSHFNNCHYLNQQ